MGNRRLIEAWRDRAGHLRRYAPEVAVAWEDAAAELEEYDREHAQTILTRMQAAEESGYTPDHISRLIKDGKIENVGKKGAPRARRGDLPRKPKRSPRPTPRLENGDPDVATEVLRQRGWSVLVSVPRERGGVPRVDTVGCNCDR